MLSLERAEELFVYDGVNLLWKVDKSSRARKGNIAGYITAKGYRMVEVDEEAIMVHRVIWLLCTGNLPEQFIDHKNGKRLDNRFDNFRDVSCLINNMNRKLRADNTSGHPGISNIRGKWVVRISGMEIGRYSQLSRAVAVRKEAEAHFGYHANHGRVE